MKVATVPASVAMSAADWYRWCPKCLQKDCATAPLLPGASRCGGLPNSQRERIIGERHINRGDGVVPLAGGRVGHVEDETSAVLVDDLLFLRRLQGQAQLDSLALEPDGELQRPVLGVGIGLHLSGLASGRSEAARLLRHETGGDH